jgi:hypothetical protein
MNRSLKDLKAAYPELSTKNIRDIWRARVERAEERADEIESELLKLEAKADELFLEETDLRIELRDLEEAVDDETPHGCTCCTDEEPHDDFPADPPGRDD